MAPVRPSLIASDLDGTLLGADGHVSHRTRHALAAVGSAGCHIVAATGRSRHTALPKLDGIDTIDWVVCSNGAMIWDRTRECIELHRPIDATLTREVIAEVRANIDGVGVGWETVDGYGFDARFFSQPPSLDELGLAANIAEPDGTSAATKLFVSHPDIKTPDDAIRVLAPALPEGVNGSTSGAAFLELTAAGVDKATTLALLCERLNVEAAEVLAFGDHLNDLAMLSWAGTGVAMGNAHPDVIAACDHHTQSNADNGVAQVIERLDL